MSTSAIAVGVPQVGGATGQLQWDDGGTTLAGTAGATTDGTDITSLSVKPGSISLKGSTSGTLVFSVPSTVTGHTLILPSAIGTAGQVLEIANAGTGQLQWTDRVPSQSGNSGKVLSTNGTTNSWINRLPDQTSHSGKALITNGSTESWGYPNLTAFSSSLNSSSPNATVNSSVLVAANGTTNQNFVAQPKGTGAFQLQVADGTIVGGTARGQYAVDLQLYRSSSNNVASGNYSFCAGSQCTAENDSSIAIGASAKSTASSAVSIGNSSWANAASSFAIGNTATTGAANSYAIGDGATTNSSLSQAFGFDTRTDGTYSTTFGRQSRANNYGSISFASGSTSNQGDAQQSFLTARNQTSDGTQTELFLNGTSARISVPASVMYAFCIRIAGQVLGGSNVGFHSVIEGTIQNSSGSTTILGTNSSRVITNTNGTWSVVAEADNTNDALVIKVTGAAATNINWVASIHLVEVGV